MDFERRVPLRSAKRAFCAAALTTTASATCKIQPIWDALGRWLELTCIPSFLDASGQKKADLSRHRCPGVGSEGSSGLTHRMAACRQNVGGAWRVLYHLGINDSQLRFQFSRHYALLDFPVAHTNAPSSIGEACSRSCSTLSPRSEPYLPFVTVLNSQSVNFSSGTPIRSVVTAKLSIVKEAVA